MASDEHYGYFTDREHRHRRLLAAGLSSKQVGDVKHRRSQGTCSCGYPARAIGRSESSVRGLWSWG